MLVAALGPLLPATFVPALVREAPQRRRRRAVLALVDRDASDAAAPLEQGLPGGGGSVLVLHASPEHGPPVVELVHLRRVADAPAGTAEVRVPARRRVADVDAAREAIGRFLLVADDLGSDAARSRGSARGLRRLAGALGLASRSVGARRARREPVVWLGVAALVASLVLLALGLADAGLPGSNGSGDALDLSACALLVGLGATACARRWLVA